jgi:sigma-B regulation protein RsbU (phosphoserine phosphatase)
LSGAPRLERLTITSEPDQLVRMRSWLWTALVGENMPLDDCAALVLAAGELCNNSIKHAYRGVAGQLIHLLFRASQDEIAIEVEDFGVPFDPSQYVPPDFDALPDHGVGLHLVNQIADRVAVDVARERGTRWTLIRHRPDGAPGMDTTH